MDAELLREKLAATLYEGQKVNRQDPEKIAQFLGIETSQVLAMPREKLFMLSSLIDVEKSTLVGDKAAKQRVMSSHISKGEFSSASKILNASFKALEVAEEKTPHRIGIVLLHLQNKN